MRTLRDTQNLVEGRRMKEIEKDVNIEVEDNDDIVFIPSVDSNQAAPTNLKVTLLFGTQVYRSPYKTYRH